MEMLLLFFIIIIKVQPLVNSGVCEGKVAILGPDLALIIVQQPAVVGVREGGCCYWPLTWPLL